MYSFHLWTCHSSLEVFRSPEVVHFIHKKYLRAFPMKSKEADWATRHHFDVIMSGALALQAKSLGWLSLKIVPLDSQCISNATSAPRCRPRLLFLYLYSVNGAIRNLAYFDSHTVLIKVCNTAHNIDCRRKKPPKFVPLKLEICLNYAYSLDLCCYNIVWTLTCFNGVCMCG